MKIGEKIGSLTILSVKKIRRGYRIYCKCECGKKIDVRKSQITQGKRKSCGCGYPPKSKGWVASDGYRRIRINNKPVIEHRYLIEQHLGRKLNKDEVVHHINGVKSDNRIKNLCVLNRAHHSRKHRHLRQKVTQLEIENKKLRRTLDNLRNQLKN